MIFLNTAIVCLVRFGTENIIAEKPGKGVSNCKRLQFSTAAPGAPYSASSFSMSATSSAGVVVGA